MAGLLDQVFDVRKALPPVPRRDMNAEALAAYFRPYSSGAMPSPPVVTQRATPGGQPGPGGLDMLSPAQRAAVLGLRKLGQAMTPQAAAGPSPRQTDIAQMQAQLGALNADRGRIAAQGLPGYLQEQQRTRAGYAPGPYQFNMPGPTAAGPQPSDRNIAALEALARGPNVGNADLLAQRATTLPQSVDPMTNLRGSLQNNMRRRFAGLGAAAPQQPMAAVEPRNAKPDLSYADFIAAKNAKRSALDQQLADFERGDTVESLTPEAAKAADEAFRQRQLLDSTAAQMNTYARRAAAAQGIGPGELLARNAKAVADRGGSEGMAAMRRLKAMDGQLPGASPSPSTSEGPGMIDLRMAKSLGVSPEQILEHNRLVGAAAAEQRYRDGLLENQRAQLKQAADQNASENALSSKKMQAQLDQNRQAHELSMAELKGKLADLERQSQLQQLAADPKNRARMAIAESNPGAVLDEAAGDPNALKELDDPLMRDMLKGKMSPDVLSHLAGLHDSADIYMGPEWDWLHPFKSHADHLADLQTHFANSLPDVPAPALKKLTKQYYNQRYGRLPAGS